MYDLARIRYVTEHYHDLQSLDRLPISLFLLTWAGYDLGWVRPTGWLAREWLFIVVSLVIVFALMVAIGKLYERAFGWLSAERRREDEFTKREWLCFYLSFLLPSFLVTARPELSHLGLVLSVVGLWGWWRRRAARKHYLAFGILLAAMSLAPLFDATLYPSSTVRDVAIKLVAAAGILAVGTIDHLTLVRTLRPIRREEEIRA
jgi:hypothetical protein